MNTTPADRRRSIASDLPTLAAAPLSGRSIVVKVVNDGAIPTAVPKYFACVPVTPSGVETEGGSRTLTDGSGRVYVCVLGPAVPMAGTYLLASEVGGRWAACYPDQGGGGITLPGCPCIDIPSPLTVDVVSQSGSTFFVDGTMTWGTVPSDVSGLYADSPAFWSEVLDYNYGILGIRYRWGLRCESGFYRLHAVAVEDPSPPQPLPYLLDTTTYVVPGAGNSCDPFGLTNGGNSILVDVDVLS